MQTVEVVAGTGGVFDVDLDGARLFTKSMIGRYPEPDDVMPLLAGFLEANPEHP